MGRRRPCCASRTRPRRRSGSPARASSGSPAAADAWRSSAGRGALKTCGSGATAAQRLLGAAGATPVADAGDSVGARALQRAVPARRAARRGALVETLETATFWSSVRPLYAAVSAALRESLTGQGTPPIILCHVSHTYRSGASLYFTVVCAQLPDAIEQWRRAKAAASEAILAAGGSISHHHGVGKDHREALARGDRRFGHRRTGGNQANAGPVRDPQSGDPDCRIDPRADRNMIRGKR